MEKTVSQKIDAILAPEETLTRDIELSILRAMPQDIPAPIVCNIRTKERILEPVAWINFSAPAYDPDNTWNPVEILRRLEANGWQTSPATLCQWEKYRPIVEFGAQESIPEEKPSHSIYGRNYKLNDSWPIIPAWVVPCQHTKPELRCFYNVPKIGIVYLHIDAPLKSYLYANRVEHIGGWRYTPGTAKHQFPQSWHTLYWPEDSPIAMLSSPKAYVDTEQGISGSLYWEPIAHEGDTFPMQASDILSVLLAQQDGIR